MQVSRTAGTTRRAGCRKLYARPCIVPWLTSDYVTAPWDPSKNTYQRCAETNNSFLAPGCVDFTEDNKPTDSANSQDSAYEIVLVTLKSLSLFSPFPSLFLLLQLTTNTKQTQTQQQASESKQATRDKRLIKSQAAITSRTISALVRTLAQKERTINKGSI